MDFGEGGEISMRELLMASAAVVAPADGPNAPRAAHLAGHPPQLSSPSPRASDRIDAILAIGIVLAAWAVALWSVSFFSRIAG
jgi:hypothetical protein